MEYEQMRAMEKTHICVQCEGMLTTIWDAENNCYRICCGNEPTHNGIARKPTVVESLARGQLDKAVGPGAQKDIEQLARRLPQRFNLVPKTDVQTGAVLSPDDITALDEFAQSIGLNIYLGHVELYFGKPRVSIDGYYYLAKKQRKDVSVLALPAVTEDYEKYKVAKEYYFSIAKGWVGGKEAHEVGLGIVTMDEIAEMSKKNPSQKRSPIVAKFPQRMAEKRAEWQLLRKLIPLEVVQSENH